ncbi:MAG: PAS domain S-box protein [Desulfomonilaceae bacterium]
MRQEDLLKEIESLRLRVSELEDTQVRLASTEQALSYSEERFRLFYENAPLGYQSLDEEGRIVEVNPAWLETLGYSREDVIGHWFGDFLAPSYQEHFNMDFLNSKAAGEIHWTDFDMVRKDGSTVSMALDGQIGRDQCGRFKQMHCIIHDLTEPRQSRQELKERQERLTLALDGASLGIWDWDLTTGRAYWTARTLGMLGYEANEFELNLKNWKKLVHPEDWPGVTENLNLHIEGKEPVFLAEYRIINKDGQWQWVRARGKVLEFGADGKPVRMAGVVVDVTDRKREEETLRRVNRALRTLSECNQALVRAQDEATLVAGLCRILVEHGGYRMAWIGFAEQDEEKSVRPVAQAGFDEGYLNTVSISWADTERGRGPTGTAIRTGQPVIARNIPADPLFDPWREAAEQRSYASSAALPLKREDRVLGALNVYAAEPVAFDAEEVRLLSELADDLAYGITALRMRVERERAESARRAADQRLVDIIEFLPDATFVIDEDKRIIAWNRACETMTGVKKQALLGLGDYAYAEPFFGERRPILIDLLDLPSQELEVTYKYISRKDHLIFAEFFIPRLRDGQGAHLWGVAAPLFDQEGQRCGAIEVIRDVTEQKRAEDELRHREERYRTLVEESFDGIFVQKGAKIAFANSRLYEMLGYDKGELEGLDHWLVYHPDYQAITRERAQARMRGEDVPIQYEVRLQGKDGSSFQGEIRARAISLNGEAGVQVWVRDISERMQTEKRLRDSERKYRELVEHANSIILRWTRDGKITFLNEFGQKFFGYSSEEILGRHVVGTIVPMTDSSGLDLGPLMDRILADPKAFERNVNENMRRDGERVWIAWTNKIVPDEQGHIAEVLSIGTDITELKRAQEELRERNTELRSINRIVLAATGFLDLEAVLEEVLDEALDLVGLEGGTICLVAANGTLELHANRATTEATVQDLSSNSVRLGDCLCGDCAHTLEPLILHDREEVLSYATRESTRGDPIHFHAAFPLVTASKCVGVLCIFTRTERKPPDQRLKLLETVTGQLALSIENAQLYEASQRHAEELERIVAERTKELAHAKERAEAADHLKSAFLANMSHELRTPLNSIIGFTGIILQGLAGPLNPEQAKQLEMVRSSSRHLLALINDVLDISKIEAGQLRVTSERFDLRESINKVIGIVAPLAEKKGIALRAQIVRGLGEAVGDQRRVEQILLNLLNNAIKFTDSGEVALKTELVPDFKQPEGISGQTAVRFCISDTGIGIKSDDLTTLFQPFRQIESGLSRNYEGTGLGLAICRRLADLMGGDMSAESTWTKGSTFSFTLPLQGSSRS